MYPDANKDRVVKNNSLCTCFRKENKEVRELNKIWRWDDDNYHPSLWWIKKLHEEESAMLIQYTMMKPT
jgi:hypothetical protein